MQIPDVGRMKDHLKIVLVLLAILAGAFVITKLKGMPPQKRADISILGENGMPSFVMLPKPNRIFPSPTAQMVATAALPQEIVHSPTAPANPPELVIYTYDGITSDWGLGPEIFPKFEGKCGCKLKVIAKGDVGVFLSQLIFEKSSPKADIALGIDNTFMGKAIDEDLLEPFEGAGYQSVDPSLFSNLPNSTSPDLRFIPFDWGYLAFVYDSEKISEPPMSLEELALPKFHKKIILEDARTSSPGKVFLHWVASEYGERTADYLRSLWPNLLTITPGWSEAYNLFLQGEAPIVLSYSTSPAYHIVNENTTKYKAAIFPKLPRQIEFVGIIKGAKNRRLAGQFIEFMLSEDAQGEIPLGNYMYPADPSVPLPDAFRLSAMPSSAPYSMDDDGKWVKIWEEALSN
jgi:thiamine transport system substrate-binding protein